MRLRLADLVGIRRAVNPVTFCREADPHRTDRVVRTGRDFHNMLRLLPLEPVLRVVGVIRVVRDRAYGEFAAGRRLFGAAYRSRKERQQPIIPTEGENSVVALVDDDLGGLAP